MTELFNVLSTAVKCVGDIIMLFALVQIGLALKDGAQGGGGQLNAGIALLIAGAVFRAAAELPALPS